MTKEQILQKHFTAEFGHDGHGKFMQYILNAMEEYAQQQVKNLNIPAVSNRLPLDVEADQLKGMIESMTGVNSKMVERLKKRLAIVELELYLNGF